MSTVADSSQDLAALVTSFERWLQHQRADLVALQSRPAADLVAAISHTIPALRALYDGGWTRLGWPESAGGLGGSLVQRAAIMEALSAAGYVIPEVLSTVEIVGAMLLRYAPELAATHLAAALRGTRCGVRAFPSRRREAIWAAFGHAPWLTSTDSRHAGQHRRLCIGATAVRTADRRVSGRQASAGERPRGHHHGSSGNGQRLAGWDTNQRHGGQVPRRSGSRGGLHPLPPGARGHRIQRSSTASIPGSDEVIFSTPCSVAAATSRPSWGGRSLPMGRFPVLHSLPISRIEWTRSQ